MKNPWIAEIVCFLFSLLFLYTGISKIIDHQAFTQQIQYSPLLNSIHIPVYWVNHIVWILSAIEIAIASMLLLNTNKTLALYVGTTMMLVFTAYIGYILTIAPFVPCSCGGVLETLTWSQHLYFNISFIIIGIVGIISSSGKTPHQSSILYKN